MRTHTTYDSDKLLCILRSVSPTCDNNEADPYAYMWIWDKERNLWLYILGFSSDYGAGTVVTLTHFDIWNDYEICEVSEKDFQNRHYVYGVYPPNSKPRCSAIIKHLKSLNHGSPIIR